MTQLYPALHDDPDDVPSETEEPEQASEGDLWFLPGPLEEEPDFLLPRPRTEPGGAAVALSH